MPAWLKRNRHSTFALISMLHEWLSSTDNSNSAVGIVLLDYQKALDLVDHTLLIAKLFSLGTKRSIFNWIIYFLRDKTQRVKLNSDCFSDWTKVPARVPQGTNLSPRLLLVMINDLTTSQLSSSNECGNLRMIQLSAMFSQILMLVLYRNVSNT